MKVAEQLQLDSVDVHILSLLQSDGRITMRKLGAEVGLSGPAVADRVRRLEERGVIRGYRADVVPERVGLAIIAFATLALPYAGRPAGALEKSVEKIDAVVECYRITGEDAYLMKLAVPSMEALGAALDQLGEFGRTRSFVALSTARPPAPLLPREAETYGRFAPSGAD